MTVTITSDPEHAEFYSHPSPAPTGDDWGYQLDDHTTGYGTGRWYPYDSPARISPDTEYRAWGNEYVSVWRDPAKAGYQVDVHLRLYLRPQGLGALVVDTWGILDLRGKGTFTRTRPADDLDEVEQAQLDGKVRRIIALMVAERRRRRTEQAPLTAHQRWMAREEEV